jgi:transcriptional regulator with XRE-family HTH domain
MAPIKPSQHKYRFDPKEISKIRQRMKITQAALAEMLDVPVNTVSRWETGASTPDAHALAAIHSAALESNVKVDFFQAQTTAPESKSIRTKLLVAWDFQNLALDAGGLEEEWGYVKEYLSLLHPGTRASTELKAYTSGIHTQAKQVLERLGFTVTGSFFNIDAQFIDDVEEALSKRPSRSVLYLIADDGDYSDLIRTQRQRGVDVYVLGTDQCSEQLKKALEADHFVHMDRPYVVVKSLEALTASKEKMVSTDAFGNICKRALDDAAVYPQDVGFSTKNPYGSLARWLEVRGLVKTSKQGKAQKAMIQVLSK